MKPERPNGLGRGIIVSGGKRGKTKAGGAADHGFAQNGPIIIERDLEYRIHEGTVLVLLCNLGVALVAGDSRLRGGDGGSRLIGVRPTRILFRPWIFHPTYLPSTLRISTA